MSQRGLEREVFEIALKDLSRKLVVSMLDGMDNMRLNMAVMNEEGRAALMEAYKGTVIKAPNPARGG